MDMIHGRLSNTDTFCAAALSSGDETIGVLFAQRTITVGDNVDPWEALTTTLNDPKSMHVG
jgi:hypothetical protein